MTTKHHNVITLSANEINKITYIPNSFCISDGQPFDPAPVIKKNGGVWTIDMNCGRHKTMSVADRFIILCGGEDYIYNSKSYSRIPEELNFYLGLKIQFSIGASSVDMNFYVAQGSNVIDNNWWIGSTGMARPRSDNPVIVPIADFNTARKRTHQVFQIIYDSDNEISFRPWM